MIGDTKANLEAAADGEKMEWSDYLRRLRADGPGPRASRRSRRPSSEIAEVERVHEKRYRKLAGQRRDRRGLPEAGRRQVALPQLRLRPRGPRGARPSARPASTPGPTSRCHGRELLGSRAEPGSVRETKSA
ncbi:MAG: hypothetical protein MZW92_60505 [Comamonadaceae bacterium]|nr:hypothetical protein [Comamonadaceae bacterium]